MEFQRMQKFFHPNHHGEEKQQMLDLNRRLETYLNRVKLLEEENDLLANEIKALRHNNQETLVHRKGLEKELQQARLEVDAAWRERVLTELEVEKLNEELQDLELQRQREAQAKVMANTKMEQSRRELEEEQRAQIWLREKVNQLEHERRLLIQTNEDDMAHMETTLSQSRAAAPPVLAQRGNQTPDLLRMGHVFSERANRAWQEASEAYQGQLAQLEESLNQARSRLNHVCQEKHENQLKLQALEKEISSAQDVQLHLEKTVDQRRVEHNQEIHQLQEHLENLEVEKEELGLQIDHLLQENRGLMQMKMSLGLEVATYRALLDSESLGADVILSNKPRNVSIRDAVLSPHGVKKNYQTQLSACLKPTFASSVLGITGPTATPVRSPKPATLNETPKILSRPANRDPAKSAALKSPFPKIVQDRAAENFSPLEVHEKVTYAETLSPSNEEVAPTESFESDQKEGRNFNVEPAESVVSQKVGSVLSSEPPRDDVSGLHQFTTADLTLCNFQVTEEPSCASDEPKMVADFQKKSEKDDSGQTEESVETQHVDKEVEEETSDSETEAMLEPTPESRLSSLESDPTESVFNQMINSNNDNSNEEVAVIKQKLNTSVETDGKEVEDKLYPDGEEMDTWDSVIERKVDVQTENDTQTEDKKQHAEPEEDISAKEPEEEIREAHQIGNMASSMTLTQAGDEQDIMVDQVLAPPPDLEEEHDEEDSQNVSVSWRTELESDSYAQENTLADTRPLIRYKSDDTDANTVASHIDESESSEGEQEKKMEEEGIGTWGDGKSKTFGTMEDLCEEVEEEALDEEYNLGYTHAEDEDVSQGTIGSEHVTLVNEEVLKNVTEEHSEIETGDLTEAVGSTDVGNDEELETDRLVEQELENLSTHSFSAHFTQQQVKEEILQMEDPDVEDDQVETEKATEDNLSTCQPGMSLNHELVSSTVDRALDNQTFSHPNVEMHITDTVAEEEVQSKDQEAMHRTEKAVEVERDISMVPHADATEDPSSFMDFISRAEMEHFEEINPEDPNSEFLVAADQKNQQDVAVTPETTEETPNDSQEHISEDVEDFHMFPDPAETAEWEVLENPMQEFEIRDQNKDDENMPESADEEAITNQEESVETSPDHAPNENDIFIVKDVTDSSLHDLFPSDVKNDFWVSSLEGGATYEPDEVSNEAAEQTDQNQGFIDNQVCENLENSAVVNGNSQLDVESSKAKAATKEQEQKKVLVYSEESEAEAESWSSGEEPV